MLGYNDNLPGSWPTNYVTQANKDDLLDDVEIVAAAAAKRADVAVMLSNTLDADLVTYDKDTDEFVKKQQSIAGDEDGITLLQDAFDGTYIDVAAFEAVTQVRDVAKQQLNWNVGDVYDADGDVVEYNGKTLIIDEETRVSTNGGDIFSLFNHQGKVYFVEDGNKLYAKFIEVESYRTAVGGDKPTQEGNKIEADNKTYNAVGTVQMTEETEKYSKWLLYFNDDDQVYAVASDKDDKDKAYFVESVSANSTKLIGSEGKKSESMDDDEVLIWNGTEFVAPSTLEVGDAIVKIAGTDDLYEMAEAKTGVLKSSTSSQYNIDGTNYKNPGTKILDGEFETADAELSDIYGNTVTYLLNDDNSLSAIIVDEVSTGTKLYGVVVDGGGDDADNWAGSDTKSLTIFTEEGTTVEYTIEDDYKESDNEVLGVTLIGKLVEYKLNKDGEIKDLTAVTAEVEAEDLLVGATNDEIEVKNNTYLEGNDNLTLASNAAIFEITEDDGDIDVTLVTRAALLAGGDFKPSTVTFDDIDADDAEGVQPHEVKASATYFLNTNDAIRAMAYTDADTSNFNYGVIDDVWFSNADFDENNALTLVGDETVYEFANDGAWDSADLDDDYVIVYTISGDEITIWAAYDVEPADNDSTYEFVTGYNDGLIALADDITVWDTDEDAQVSDSTIMTDANTVVYVINDDGEAVEGTLDDIDKNAYVYVPVMDDGVAEIVIVNEYSEYTNVDEDGEYTAVEGDATMVIPTSAPGTSENA